MERYFISSSPKGEEYILEGEEFHHLQVKRLKDGDIVSLFDGTGFEYSGEIICIEKKQKARIKILSKAQVNRELSIQITLGQALPKNQAWDIILQKGTELGVQSFMPIVSKYIATENWRGRSERWRKIIISACKQCGRNHIPDVFTPMPMADSLNIAKEKGISLKLIAHPSSSYPSLKQVLEDKGKGISGAFVLVGPEGGWSDEELDIARDQCVYPFCLGPRVLRAETASLAILAGFNFFCG